MIQGPDTCFRTLNHLRYEVSKRKSLTIRLLNYTKQGRPFLNVLMLAPFEDDSGCGRSLYIGVADISFLDEIGTPAPMIQQRPRVQLPWSMQQQKSWHAPTGFEESVPKRAQWLQPFRPQAEHVEKQPVHVQPFLVKLVGIVMSDKSEELLKYQPWSRTFNIAQPHRFEKEVPSPCGL